MKIQILTHGREHFASPKKYGAWHRIAQELAKTNKVDFILKKEWPTFYFRYLRFRPDILVVTGVIGYYAMKLKKLGLIRCPIVLAWNDYFTEQMGGKWGIAKIGKMEYYMAANADFITTPSLYLKKICDILGKKSEYVPHGVTDIHKEKIDLKGKLKLLYIGEISRYKEVDKIIQDAKGLSCNLYLIGDVSDKEIIENLPPNVSYEGFKNHIDAIKYINSSDFVIISNDQDSNLKMMEYLACGKPILAYKGRIGYVLTHREDAFLYNDLRKGIETLSKDKLLVKKITEGAKKFKVISWNENANKHLKIFQSLIEKK